MTVGSLFSGIGGLDLGLERAGMTVKWQCEIDPYCRSVLTHHWPDVPCYEDIHAIQGDTPYVDLIAGGFPCQPVSLAGKGLAQKDPRWLWPEFARVVGLLQPRYVLMENVPGLARRGLLDVLGDLSTMGFDAEWQVVSAASIGAPHIRERIFVFAYPDADSERFTQRCECDCEEDFGRKSPRGHDVGGLREDVADSCGERRQQIAGSSRCYEASHGRRTKEDHLVAGDGEGDRTGQVPGDVAHSDSEHAHRPWVFGPGRWPELADGSQWEIEPEVGRVADGVSGRVAQLRALGNAVVPQVAEFVGRCIMAAA